MDPQQAAAYWRDYQRTLEVASKLPPPAPAGQMDPRLRNVLLQEQMSSSLPSLPSLPFFASSPGLQGPIATNPAPGLGGVDSLLASAAAGLLPNQYYNPTQASLPDSLLIAAGTSSASLPSQGYYGQERLPYNLPAASRQMSAAASALQGVPDSVLLAMIAQSSSPPLNYAQQQQQQQIVLPTSSLIAAAAAAAAPPPRGRRTLVPRDEGQDILASAASAPEPPTNVVRKTGRTFPMKLIRALRLYEQQHPLNMLFAWLPDGRTFTVLNEDGFLRDVLQAHKVLIANARYESFVRKMHRWGFNRRRMGGGHCFHHELFQRDQPHLCELMRWREHASSKATEEE